MNLFFFFYSLFIVGVSSECQYDLLHLNGSVHRCSPDQCDRSVDPSSLQRVDPLCQTSFFTLSFSTFEHFRLFLTGISGSLSDLFLRHSSSSPRTFRLFVHRLTSDEFPFSYREVIRLGMRIDLYQVLLLHLPPGFSHRHSIDRHPDFPRWSLIQMKIECRSLTGFDSDACDHRILSPERRIVFELPSTDAGVKNETRRGDWTWLWIFLPLLIIVLLGLLSGLIFLRRKDSPPSREPSMTEVVHPEEESNYEKFSLQGQLQFIPNSFSSSSSLRF